MKRIWMGLTLLLALLICSSALAETVYVVDPSGNQSDIGRVTEINFDTAASQGISFNFDDTGHSGPFRIEVSDGSGNSLDNLQDYYTGDVFYPTDYGSDVLKLALVDSTTEERFFECTVNLIYPAPPEEPEESYEEPEESYDEPEESYDEPEESYDEPVENYDDSGESYDAPAENYDEGGSYQGDGGASAPEPAGPEWVGEPVIGVSPCVSADGGMYTVDSTDVTLSWSADGSVAYYTLQITDLNSGSDIANDSGMTTELTIPADYLYAGSAYEICVGAVPNNGTEADAVYSYAWIEVPSAAPAGGGDDSSATPYDSADDSLAQQDANDGAQPDVPEPAPAEPMYVGDPYISVEPEWYRNGDLLVVAGDADVALSWSADGAATYLVDLRDENGYGYIDNQYTDQTGVVVSPGIFAAGTYEMTVTAFAADQTPSNTTSLSFAVEMPEAEPTAAPVGMPALQVSPEQGRDGDLVIVAQDAEIVLSWSAENAVGYYVALTDDAGNAHIHSEWMENGQYVYSAGALDAGTYTLTVTAVGADGASAGPSEMRFRVEAPEPVVTEVPATEVPATEVPATEVPATEVPATEVPATEVPATEVPATEVPATEVPATEVPATEVPATEVPVTEAPATEAPNNAYPGWETPSFEDFTPTPTPEVTPTPTEAAPEITRTPTPEQSTVTEAPASQERVPVAPSLFVNDHAATDVAIRASAGAVLHLNWDSPVADYYLIEIGDLSEGNQIYSEQSVETTLDVEANTLLEGHEYLIKVSAGVVESGELASSTARVSVAAAPQEQKMLAWVNPGERKDDGSYEIDANQPAYFNWNLSSAQIHVVVTDQGDGSVLYDSDQFGGIANAYDLSFDAGFFQDGGSYRIAIELPETGQGCELYFTARAQTPQGDAPGDGPSIDEPSSDSPAQIPVITITPTGESGQLVPMQIVDEGLVNVYAVPEDGKIAVELSANVQPYPACSIALINYSTQERLQFLASTNAQRWEVPAQGLGVGDLYILIVTPNVAGAESSKLPIIIEKNEEPPSSGFMAWFEGSGDHVNVELMRIATEATAFNQVKSVVVRWTSVGSANTYYITLYELAGSSKLLLKDTQVTGTRYAIDAVSLGMKANRTYEISISPVDTSDSATLRFLFRKDAPVSQPNQGGTTVQPGGTATVRPNFVTRRPNTVKPLVTRPVGGVPSPSNGVLNPAQTMAPLASLNNPSGRAQLVLDEDPFQITAGSARTLSGKIVSTAPLSGVEFLLDGQVIHRDTILNSYGYNLNQVTIDTANDAAWQNRQGESRIEVYVTYAGGQATSQPVQTAVPIAPRNFGMQISLATVPPANQAGSAATTTSNSSREKLGEIPVQVVPAMQAATGSGNGLQLSLFDLDPNLQRTGQRAIAPAQGQVNFHWDPSSMQVMGNDISGAEQKWDGWVQAKYSGRVRFEVYASNGVRLTVDGQKLIDEWAAQPSVAHTTGWIDVTAGEKYILSLDSFQQPGGGDLMLYWEYESQPGAKEIVPLEFLYSATDSLFNPGVATNAVSTYGLSTQQADALDHISMLAADDRYGDAILHALDEGIPIVFALEGAGSTAPGIGGSLHSQGRMDAMVVVVSGGEIKLLDTSASTLPDIPRATPTMLNGAMQLTLETRDATSGTLSLIHIGEAQLLSNVDGQCPYCGNFVTGSGVWHACTVSQPGLDVMKSTTWAVTDAQANPQQGVTLGSKTFDDLAAEMAPSGRALLVVDRYYMDETRLDYEWLYDNVGLGKLLHG